MQHLKVEVDFKDIEPFEKLEFDTQLTQKGYEEDLKRFVSTYYEQDFDGFKSEDYDSHFKGYQVMINSAIKNNNLLALEILWQGVYWHDYDHPNFAKDVYVAAKFGTLNMFQHCVYAFMNYSTLVDWTLNIDKLCELAKEENLAFLKHIASCAVDGEIEPIPQFATDKNSYPAYYESATKFYQLVESF